jgi:hypothetical protein
MPKWWATSCTTVMRTCSSTSASVAQRRRMGSRKMVIRSGMTRPPYSALAVRGTPS